MTPVEVAYRCGILAISLTSSALFVADVPGSAIDSIRCMWLRQAGMASTAMQLATIAAGRAKAPPLGIEDTRAQDWLDGLCD